MQIWTRSIDADPATSYAIAIARDSICFMAAPPHSVAVVLVRARNPLNIGAAARAMSNFGFPDLRIVTDYPVPFHDARSAVNAASVLQSARLFGTVAQAVADCSLVYGTTALGERRLEHPVDLLRNAADRITHTNAQKDASDDPAIPRATTAILFGSEKTGLSNEELSYCQRLLTIPMHEGGISMNLGQAVAVCLYELTRGAPAPRALPLEPTPATAEELDRLETLLREVLLESDYDARFPGNLGQDSLRRLIRRLGLPAADAPIWMGMLRQVLWKLRR